MQLVEILGNYMHIWQIVDIPGNGGLLNAVQELDFLPGFNFEGFPIVILPTMLLHTIFSQPTLFCEAHSDTE